MLPASGQAASGSYVLTLQFIPFFVIGVALARYRHELIDRLRALQTPAWVAIASLTLLLYTRPWWTAIWGTGLIPADAQAVTELAACSGFILMALAWGPISQLLRTAPLQYLGRISYSLYLVHAIVILALAHLFYDRVPTALLLAVICAAALALATLTELVVERPSVALGRRLTRPRVARTGAASAVVES